MYQSKQEEEVVVNLCNYGEMHPQYFTYTPCHIMCHKKVCELYLKCSTPYNSTEDFVSPMKAILLYTTGGEITEATLVCAVSYEDNN